MLTQGPGLRIEVWDDDIDADDFIGSTEIDLENRLFCPKWSQMKLKPIESRSLWTDVSRSPQGKLEMFVEILTPEEAMKSPPKNIAPPPPKPFELRVVIWQIRVGYICYLYFVFCILKLYRL